MKRHYNRKIGKLVIISSISLFVLFSWKALSSNLSCGDEGRLQIEHPTIEVVDQYDNADGYYIFYNKDEEKRNDKVVGFVHGYGAINPMIFGAWIKHLVQNGNTVVYPRYQKNLILPSADHFTKNAGTALEQALKSLYNSEIIDPENTELYLFGHSFGGVIISNLMADLETYGLPKPKGALVAEGGTGPFTGAMLDDYSSVDRSIPMMVVVGDRDLTVGDYFGKKLFSELQVDHSVFIRQKAFSNGMINISASHYEPYSIDSWCDNGIDNLTKRRALYVGKLDVVNYNGYWKWLDALMEANTDWEKVKNELFHPENPIQLTMGDSVLSEVLEVHYKVPRS